MIRKTRQGKAKMKVRQCKEIENGKTRKGKAKGQSKASQKGKA